MKNLKHQNEDTIRYSVIFSILISGCMLLIFIGIMFRFHSLKADRELALANKNIQEAVVQCYAMEGSYPQELDYLIENYNLSIDTSRYDVIYEYRDSSHEPKFDVILK